MSYKSVQWEADTLRRQQRRKGPRINPLMHRFIRLLLGKFGEEANVRGSDEGLGSRQEDLNLG